MDLEAARKRLEGISAELDRSLSVLAGARQGAGGAPPDPADSGANLSAIERSEAMVAAARRLRGDVLAALERVEAGTYGSCTDCGGLLPQGRLEAKPEAARCVPCQARADRRRR